MTQKSNKIETDELDMLLSAAEHGMAGQLLRAGREDLGPNPEFAQELETRLLANAAPPANPAQAKRVRPVVVTGIPGRLKAPPGDRDIRPRRIGPLAMGALGIAAMILLFVGMAAMINRRQQLNLNGQTPVPNEQRQTLTLVPRFALLRTLTLQLTASPMQDMIMGWSPTGHKVVASQGAEGFVWDADTGKPLANLSPYRFGRVDSLAFSPDGGLLALASSSGDPNGKGIRLMDPQTGQQKAFFPPLNSTMPSYQMSAESLAWSPTGSFLASVAEEVGKEPANSTPQAPDAYPLPVGVIRVWNVTTGKEDQTIRVSNNQTWGSVIFAIAWSPVGNTLAALSYGGVLQLWDALTGKLLFSLATIKMYDIPHMQWSPDGHILAIVSGRQVQLWDATSGKLLRSLPQRVSPLPTPLPTVDISVPPVPTAIAPAVLRPTVSSLTPTSSEYNNITSLLWSPDGHTLVTADGGHIRLWNPATGEIKATIEDSTYILALSPDGSVLAGSNSLNGVRLWDVVRGVQIATLPYIARYMAWSSDGSMLALSNGEGNTPDLEQISIWGVPSAVEPTATVIAKQTVELSVPSPEITSISTMTTIISVPTVATSQATGAPIPPTTPLASESPTCRTWSVVDSPNVDSVNQLESVAAISNDNVWAVGFHNSGSPPSANATSVSSPDMPLILHWDGKSWQNTPSPNVNLGTLSSRLYSVSAVSANDIWAVGSYSDANSPEMELEANIGQAVVLHWDGSAWKFVSNLPTTGKVSSLDAVAAIAPDDVWAAGYYTIYGSVDSNGKPIPHALFLHWDGKAWTEPTNSLITPPKGWVYGLEAISSNDIWAVGLGWKDLLTQGSDEPFVSHWDGTTWQQQTPPSNSTGSLYLKNIAASSKDDVWVVGADQYGDSGVAHIRYSHWDGKRWTDNPSFLPAESSVVSLMFLYDVVARASNDVWAVGYQAPLNGQIDNSSNPMLIHWDGYSLSYVQNPATHVPSGSDSQAAPKKKVTYLTSIAAVKGGDIWAVGGVLSEQTRHTLIMRYGPGVCGTATPKP